MGAEKTTSQTSGSTSNTQTATATPAELKWQEDQATISRASVQDQIAMNRNASADVNTLLTGGNLPGNLGVLSRGLDENAISDITNMSLRSLYPQFAQNGILDSGTAASASARTAGDIRRGAYEYNIGNLQNLLNLGVGGQAQVQQPMLATQSMLGSSLAGLRTISSSGTSSSNTTLTQMNPFLKSFQQSFGSSLGSSLGESVGTGGASAGGKFMKGFMSCWVAAEIFGGWNTPKTCLVRYYINSLAPQWFKRFYLKHGEAIAKFIHNKPILKLLLRPLFEMFANLALQKIAIGGVNGQY